MRVLVTGGTGFVGSHTVAALLRAGHEPVLLVRDAAKPERVFGPLAVDPPELIVGDVTDAHVVARALDGCDAVLHGAAMVAMDRRRAQDVLRTNLRATQLVLGGAHERELDPIVHVSSLSALSLPDTPVITRDTAIGTPSGAYGRSKASAERYARWLQSQGAPVVISYPGAVLGPHDPGPGESTKGVIAWLQVAVPATVSGCVGVDVRDLAAVHAEVMEQGRGPRRFLCGPWFLSWSEMGAVLDELTGRRLRRLPLPAPAWRALGRFVDIATRVVPVEVPSMSYEVAQFITECVPCDSSDTTRELGIEFRSASATLEDALRWLLDAGHISPEDVPRLTR